MDNTLLCVSWLNGQVKAASVDRGSAKGTWERPAVVADFTGFSGVLAEAVEQTKSDAKQVAMVLAHPRLSHQVVEVPPTKGWTLQRFLLRRVQHLKTFDGEAAWASQPAMPTKNTNALALHVFPKSVADQLTGACEELDLQLVRLVSTTAVLGSQLKELPLEKDELALVAAETGTTTTVVIGQKDGRVCLGRVLRGRWNQQLDPLAIDLTRTIGFAEQESGLVVRSVWLFGPGAQTHAPALQDSLHLPVKLSPVEYSPFYWTEQAAKLPEKDDGNLVSLESRQAPQRRRLVTATGLILLSLFIASLVTTGFIELFRKGEKKAIAKQQIELNILQTNRVDWQKRYDELARKKDLTRIVSDERPPPLPAWFLGFLSDAVPDDLLLTECRVTRTNDAWSVLLAGAVQPPTDASHPVMVGQVFATLTNNLSSGPFHLKISRSTMSDALAATPLAPSIPKRTTNMFLIEGVIR